MGDDKQAQSQQPTHKFRTDPYMRLMSPNTKVRTTAIVQLVEDIHKNHQIDEEKAKNNNTTVQLTPLGLTRHLQYVLTRLISGLESTDRLAPIGFASALVLVLESFDQTIITPTILETLITERHQNAHYGSLTANEQQSFDLGCLFLIQSLERANRLQTISSTLLETLLRGVSRLGTKYPQMQDIAVEAVITLCEICYKSSSQHYQALLRALIAFVPTQRPRQDIEDQTKSNNKHVTQKQLSQWTPASITAALALRRLKQTTSYARVFPGFFEDRSTWETIFSIISPTISHFPSIPTVWVNILLDSLTIPGHFEGFWNEIIVTNLISEYAHHRKGIALTIINNFLFKILQLVTIEPTNHIYSETILRLIISTLFNSPDLIKTIMTHARARETPLYLQAVSLLDTLETFCTTFKIVIPTIISIFNSPTKGGSRAFDAKSNTKFMYKITQLLHKSELIAYISSIIDNFNNAEEIITNDIKHIVQLTKERQDSLSTVVDSAESTKKKDTKKGANNNGDDDENSVTNAISKIDFSQITDVNVLMGSDIVKKAIAHGVTDLQCFSVDHIYHLCELLFKLQRTAQHNIAQEQQKLLNAQEKGKKGKGQKAKEPKESSLLIDSLELEQCLQKCLTFLYSHAFYKPTSTSPSITNSKSKTNTNTKNTTNTNINVQQVSNNCQDVCKQRFISLFSTLLLADSHYHNYSSTSLDFGPHETRWGSFIYQLDTSLRNMDQIVPKTALDSGLTKAIADTTNILAVLQSWIDTMVTKYNTDRARDSTTPGVQYLQKYINIATMMKYLSTALFSLLYSDVPILMPILSDMKFVLGKIIQEYLAGAPRGTKLNPTLQFTKDENDFLNDGALWVDILIDILLSVLGLGHNVTRHVVLRSFKIIVPHLQMSSITLLIDPLAQQLDSPQQDDDDEEEDEEDGNGTKSKKSSMNDEDDDEILDFSDDDASDFSDLEGDEELDEAIRQINKNDEDDENNDDDDNSEEEIDALITTDILLGHQTSYITEEQEAAVAGIIRLQKEHHRQKKDKIQSVMLMRLRILDLIEVIIDEMFATNAWLSLLLPMMVLIKNSSNHLLSPLHSRAISLFRDKLCVLDRQSTFFFSQRNELKLTESDPFSSYIQITSSTTDPNVMIQPQQIPHGDNIQSVLEAFFESLSMVVPTTTETETKKTKSSSSTPTPNQSDRSTMAGYALSALASLYIIAPAGPSEYQQFNPKETTTKRSTRSKTAPASTLSSAELQQKIYQYRVNYVSTNLIPLVKKHFLESKKDYFSPTFFKLLSDSPVFSSACMWYHTPNGSILSILQESMEKGQTTFLRKSAMDIFSTIFKHYRYTMTVHDQKSLYQDVSKMYIEISKMYENSIQSYENAVATPIEKPTKVSKQPQKSNQGGKKLRETLKGIKLGFQSVVERIKSFIQKLELSLGIKQSIISSNKTNNKNKKSNDVTPQVATKTKSNDATPQVATKKVVTPKATPDTKPQSKTPLKKKSTMNDDDDIKVTTHFDDVDQVDASPVVTDKKTTTIPSKRGKSSTKSQEVITPPVAAADVVPTTPRKRKQLAGDDKGTK